MEEILKKANELGLMIKGTEVAQRFEELSKQLEKDKASKELLEEYVAVMNQYSEKESKGETIEVEEKNKVKELSEKVTENNLIKEYIATHSYFINMMMQIQQAISEPKGEPIKESKIIKPNNTGKIITDI